METSVKVSTNCDRSRANLEWLCGTISRYIGKRPSHSYVESTQSGPAAKMRPGEGIAFLVLLAMHCECQEIGVPGSQLVDQPAEPMRHQSLIIELASVTQLSHDKTSAVGRNQACARTRWTRAGMPSMAYRLGSFATAGLATFHRVDQLCCIDFDGVAC